MSHMALQLHTLPAWQEARKHFQVDSEEIGRGTFGVVRRGKDSRNGSVVMLKSIVLATASEEVNCASEVQIMQKLTPHPNILQLLGAYFDKELHASGGQTFSRCTLILEPCLMDIGTYMSRVGMSCGVWQTRFLKQLADGLTSMHSQQVLHRDLKPANILVRPANFVGELILKIADFGTACQLGRSVQTVVCPQCITTFEYAAPELLVIRNATYSAAADIFSAGLVGAEWCMGAQLNPLTVIEAQATNSRFFQAAQATLKKGIKQLQLTSSSSIDVFSTPQGQQLTTVLLECLQWESADRPRTGDVKAWFEEMHLAMSPPAKSSAKSPSDVPASGSVQRRSFKWHCCMQEWQEVKALLLQQHGPVSVLSVACSTYCLQFSQEVTRATWPHLDLQECTCMEA